MPCKLTLIEACRVVICRRTFLFLFVVLRGSMSFFSRNISRLCGHSLTSSTKPTHRLLRYTTIACCLLLALYLLIPRQPKELAYYKYGVPFCSGIIHNNKTDIKNALEHMKIYKNAANLPLKHYFIEKNQPMHCERFREQRRYILKPLSMKEAKFPIAYSLLGYKDIEQMERLLRAIYMPQNYYCIHVDRKMKAAMSETLKNYADCFPNVFIASKLEDVKWGTITVLQAEINCMKDLLRYKPWRYFINLTGQEFPLVSNSKLVELLSRLNNTNVIEAYPLKKVRQEIVDRTKWKWLDGKRTKHLKGSAPHNIVIAKGSVHVILTRGFVDYVINKRQSRDFLEWLRDTGVPDETFFASLHYNKHLKIPGSQTGSRRGRVNFTVRFKIWNHHDGELCEGKWVREICVVGVGDLHAALTGGSWLFINKLHSDFQPLALDCLEEYQRNNTLYRDTDL